MFVGIANIIALVRIGLLPVIIYFINRQELILATTLLFLAFISEFFHGYLHKKGEIRSFFDPFSHKLFIIGLLTVFYLRDEFHGAFLLLFLVRDGIVAYIKWMAARDDAIVRFDVFSKSMVYLQFGIIFSILIFDIVHLGSKFGAFLMDRLTIIFILFSAAMAIISVVHNAYVYLSKLTRRKKHGRELDSENMIVLANKRSTGYKSRYRRRLLRLFAQRREVSIKYLPNEKEMYDHVNASKYDHIVIAGGDGSFESALNYKPFRKKSLGFFPLGAGNAFYSYFYKGKRFEYLRSRFPFREVEMDVLEIEWDSGKKETMFCTIGVDAEVIKLSKTDGEKSGFWHYFNASVEGLIKLKPSYDLGVTVGKKKINWKNVVNFTIGKVPYYGFGVRSLLGNMQPADGHVLGLAVVNNHFSFLNKPLRVWALLLSMTGIYASPLVAVKGKEIVIESSKKFPLQAGGDFLGYSNKLKVRVVRKQKVLMI